MPKKTQGASHVSNPLEAVKSLPSEFGNTVANETQQGGIDFLRQLLGTEFGSASKNSSEKKAEQPQLGKGVVFDAAHHGKTENAANKKSAEKHAKPERAAAMDYHTDIVRSSERSSRMEVRSIDQKIQQITIELRKLISSSKVLQMEFAQVAVEENPSNAGEYHVNFFDWMLVVIRNAREKVENSGAWLNTVKGKGGKKGKGNGYWDMFKKHGTTFGQSNERNVATQTG